MTHRELPWRGNFCPGSAAPRPSRRALCQQNCCSTSPLLSPRYSYVSFSKAQPASLPAELRPPAGRLWSSHSWLLSNTDCCRALQPPHTAEKTQHSLGSADTELASAQRPQPIRARRQDPSSSPPGSANTNAQTRRLQQPQPIATHRHVAAAANHSARTRRLSQSKPRSEAMFGCAASSSLSQSELASRKDPTASTDGGTDRAAASQPQPIGACGYDPFRSLSQWRLAVVTPAANQQSGRESSRSH